MQKGYRVVLNEGCVSHILYDTEVVKYSPKEKRITIWHGGWITASTCKAINNALASLQISGRVFRKRGVMFLCLGEWEPIPINEPFHLTEVIYYNSAA